jgi:hypothetical protein
MLQISSMKVTDLPKVDPLNSLAISIKGRLKKSMWVDGDVNTRFKV